jgi:2-polyprenyl-3-methyl-5-hydroxy-6-metoxy-1,4-benzoquinol methylase
MSGGFDERARDWDTPERIARAAAVATAIRRAIPISPTARAIEVGAGTGLLGLQLAGEVGELLLTDPSARMLEVATEKVERAGLAHVRVARFDLLADPPPPPGTFDLVLSLLMLHHVESTAAVLGALFDLLAPGGRLAMSDLDTEDGSFHDPDAEGIHHRGFDRDRLRTLTSEAGFSDVAVTSGGEIERDGRRYPLFLLTAVRP